MSWCRSSGMSNSSWSRLKFAKQTVIRVRINSVHHTKPSHTTKMTQRQETSIIIKPGHRIHLELKKLNVTFSRDPHTGEQYSRNGRTDAKQQQSNTKVSTNRRFINLKIPILCETRETIPRTWSSNMSLLSNFTPRMARLGLARIETPDKTKSPWGGLRVLDLQTTRAIVMLGFSITHQDCTTPES